MWWSSVDKTSICQEEFRKRGCGRYEDKDLQATLIIFKQME
jgi:hypothetical protein